MAKIAILGCGRGFGAKIVHDWEKKFPTDELFLSSRSVLSDKHQVFQSDFSKETSVVELIEKIREFAPERLFYFAGGGPYGPYLDKKWQSHAWALNVSLITPMKLAQELLPGLQQLIFTGSAVAESAVDINAASYSAAKHGLLGFVKTLKDESEQDIRLFSPTYMDTEMVPVDSAPRANGACLPLELASSEFINWAQETSGDWHFLLKKSAT